jgi:TolB-like protein
MQRAKSKKQIAKCIELRANSQQRRAKGEERRDKNYILFVLFSLLLALSSMFFAVNSGHTAQKDFKGRIALFPFENLSVDKNALTSVMPVLREKLEAKGFDILDEDSLNQFLLKERIRCTGYITKDTATKLKEELNVEAILVGSINSFSNGENPQAGFSARLVSSSDCSIIWANHASATGEDFTSILGLGRIKSIEILNDRLINRLLESFRVSQPEKEIESTYRIAVMPFQNKSKVKDVGMLATYMFIVELFKSKKYVPLEYGEIRCLIVNLRLKDKGELDYKKTEVISESSGVDGIIVGTVDMYHEGEGTAPPEVSISARLIDAHKDKILWSNSYQLKGDDNIFMLDWGRINSPENVAYQAISKLVKEMSKTKWH